MSQQSLEQYCSEALFATIERSMMRIIRDILAAAIIGTLICGCGGTAGAVSNSAASDVSLADDGNLMMETDYMELMKRYCASGDIEAGREAALARDEKIDTLHLDIPKVRFDELLELSRLITSEAGSSWLSMDWKIMVGEVVLNRVRSPEYPDSITDVIHQKHQYAGTNSSYFARLVPYTDCVEAASRLLCGERIINDTSVIFQSDRKQGSGVYIKLHDDYCGSTYLCYSSHPELYEEVRNENY